MSERFGIPDHDPQIPGHAPENPTPLVSFGGMGGFDVPAYNPPVYGGGGGGGGGVAGTYNYVPRKMLKRSMILAVILATVLGPLGLFYVNLLNGIAALAVFAIAMRPLALILGIRPGGDLTGIYLLGLIWCINVPWSIVGVLIHNGRIQDA
jgi:hypothetical protein